MEITEYVKDDIKIMSVSGKLNAASAEAFESKLLNNIANGEKKIILDFKKLDFISSRGIRIFYKAFEKMQGSDGKIVFAGINQDIKKVFELVELENDFPIFKDVDLAVQSAF
ncbi:MAG TPA: STAS domain-containing protein [bacterium]|nr:STAS domain-containing protein [bacterium]HPN29704.1 STAS domain-containing protein [bacterium]